MRLSFLCVADSGAVSSTLPSKSVAPDTVCFAGFEIMCDFDGSPRDCGVVMNMNKIQVFKRPGPGALKIEYAL